MIEAGARIACVAAVMGCVLLLGVRTLTSEDLGYHLGYGEAFLDSGRLIDHDARLYTLPAQELAADLRPAAGPGCWYDAEGRYRFPNANWLSQVLMASAYRLGGVAGLSLLRLGLVGMLLACVAVLLHRLRVPWRVGLGAILLTALVAYPRFSLRPELFGYVVLAGQMALLGGVLRDGASGTPLRSQAMGLVALQWLFTNLHSYFLLGLALTGAMLGGAVVSMLWGVRSLTVKDERRETARRNARSLAALLAAQGLVCFLNPWTWRLAVLPFQTLAYLRVNRIGAGPGMHPWSTIKELAGSSLRMLGSGPMTVSYAASWVAALVGLAGLAAAGVRKRWGVAMIVLGMMLVGAAANRNLAIAAIVVIPLSVGVCAEPARRWVLRWPAARRAWMARGVCVVWIALSVGIIAALVSHRF